MYQKLSYHLLIVKQVPQENLRSYVQRFNLESMRVDIPDEKFSINAFIVGLGIQSKYLMFSISKNPQDSMVEVLAKEEKYINAEKALMSKRGSSSGKKEKSKDKKKQDQSPRKQRDRDRSPRRNREERDRSSNRRDKVRDRLGPPQLKLQPRYPPQQFTPLTASVSQFLYKVQHEKFLRWSSQIKMGPAKKDTTKYSEFHKDHGHRTDDYIPLKKEIEFII